ncbi:MAG: ATP-binding cassette domain-containing protein, partial [Synechococcus sp.]
MAAAIAIQGLPHHFGHGAVRRQVLFDVALQVEAGEIVLLTGPSGSGKTTLLTLIGGLRAAQSGSLRVLNRELVGASPLELTLA